MATLKHLRHMGEMHEIEPGVLEVVTVTGRRLRWLRVFGTDRYQLVSVDECAAA
jgi:hypothetical protein